MKRLLVCAALIGCAAVGVTAAACVAPPANSSTGAQQTSATAGTSTTSSAPTTTTTTTTTTPPAPTTTTTVATPALSAAEAAAIATRVQSAVQSVVPDAAVGMEVFDRQTNTVVTSFAADQQFHSMSVVKLLIALDLLDTNNWVAPDTSTQQELHQMLAASDDNIADNLWDAGGGPEIINRMVGLLGLTGTQPPQDAGEWGDTLITAQDMVAVYRYITDELTAPDRDLLIGALSDAQRVAADGTDQYFGIPNALPHVTWAVKQGWGTSGSDSVFNTTGLVGTGSRYVLVLLTNDPSDAYSTDPEAVTAGVTALAGLVGGATS